MLYIANCTKQTWLCNVRVPETNRIMVVEVPSGQQREIGSGLSEATIEHMVRYLERFGVRDHQDSKLDSSTFDGYLYSRDKPVKSDKIEMAHDALVDHQERRSATEATRNALAFDKSTTDKRTKKRLASVTEVEVSEDVPNRQKPTGKERKMKITVDKNSPNNPDSAKIPV